MTPWCNFDRDLNFQIQHKSSNLASENNKTRLIRHCSFAQKPKSRTGRFCSRGPSFPRVHATAHGPSAMWRPSVAAAACAAHLRCSHSRLAKQAGPAAHAAAQHQFYCLRPEKNATIDYVPRKIVHV
jgi:hypothetical protein